MLLSARHPGLTGRVVPIDVRLGDGYTALVVTGPNTGGKTVTLRTLGLLALMHQAGLHIPAAAGSRLPIFRDVFADIGDEQSIAQSLSTFSGHLRSIIRIVEAAGPGHARPARRARRRHRPDRGLGARPGAARPLHPAGALVAATTHYAELKAYAHTTPGRTNASVEFDLETLSPTYRLTIGLPGGSQAFAIAERLGLPEAIVADARSRLTEAQRTFEATLAAIRETEGETSEALDRARAAELRAAEALRAAEEERRRARRERDEAVRAAREEAERLVAELRDELARRRAGRSSARRSPRPRSTRPWPRRGRRSARLPGREAAGAAASAGGAAHAGASATGAEPRRGAGRAASRRSIGAAGGRRSRPAACGSRWTSTTSSRPSSRCRAAGTDGGGRGADVRTSAALRLGRARAVASSLDLRGARVEEALETLDALPRRRLAGGPRPVTIIHGLGTGALRDAVRPAAGGHPLVKASGRASAARAATARRSSSSEADASGRLSRGLPAGRPACWPCRPAGLRSAVGRAEERDRAHRTSTAAAVSPGRAGRLGRRERRAPRPPNGANRPS